MAHMSDELPTNLTGESTVVLGNHDQSLLQFPPERALLMPTHSPSVRFCQTMCNEEENSSMAKDASLFGATPSASVLSVEPLKRLRLRESLPFESTTEITARVPFESSVAACSSDIASPTATRTLLLQLLSGRCIAFKEASALLR